MGRPASDPVERFFKFVQDDGDCWVWTGFLDRGGYATFTLPGGRRMKAHRWSYSYFIDDIPEGLHIDHLCRNRACVNPWHLEPVPMRVNVLRGTAPSAVNAAKTHCKRGHEFDESNTIRIPAGRECRACRREIYKRYRLRKKEAA
jgi:hypothetical protein